jgi:hypothetical protein
MRSANRRGSRFARGFRFELRVVIAAFFTSLASHQPISLADSVGFDSGSAAKHYSIFLAQCQVVNSSVIDRRPDDRGKSQGEAGRRRSGELA